MNNPRRLHIVGFFLELLPLVLIALLVLATHGVNLPTAEKCGNAAIFGDGPGSCPNYTTVQSLLLFSDLIAPLGLIPFYIGARLRRRARKLEDSPWLIPKDGY